MCSGITESGKVTDVEVLLSFCKACKLKSQSNPDSAKNHAMIANTMEIICTKQIFLLSEANLEQYARYFRNEDTKTFLEFQNAQPYGKLEVQT